MEWLPSPGQRRCEKIPRVVILREAKDLGGSLYVVNSRETAVILRFSQDDIRLIFSLLPST